MLLRQIEANNAAVAKTTSIIAYAVAGLCAMCCCCLMSVGMYFYVDYRKKERELEERIKMNMMFN